MDDKGRLNYDVARMTGHAVPYSPLDATAGPNPGDAEKDMRDPLADAVRALKIAEMALELNLAGVKERRAEIKERKKEVARAYFEALGKKQRTRKGVAK